MLSGAAVAEASELLELVVEGVCIAEDSFALDALRDGVPVDFSCRRVDLLGVEAAIATNLA